MNRIIFCLLMMANIPAIAQKKQDASTFAKTITEADLKKHLYIVAGKEMEGRETGYEGQRRAAAYIENEFKRIGLQPGFNGGYQQPFALFQDSLTGSILQVNGQKYAVNKDYEVVLSSSSGKLAFSEGVYIPARVPADSLKPGSLAGKLVIISGERRSLRYSKGSQRLEALRAAAPAAILYVTRSRIGRSGAGREMTLSSFKKSILPQQFYISEGVASAIAGNQNITDTLLQHVVPFTVDVLLSVDKITKQLQSTNVIGVLPGSDRKDEYLFVTAHYDHLGRRDTVINYGADDDGSGTVALLEMAEAFSKAKAAGKGASRSIVFMTVSGEEKGLLGSEYYSEHPVFPLEKTSADLNIDMVGRTDERRKPVDSLNFVYIVGDDKISTASKPINEEQNKKYINLVLDYKYNDPADTERIYFRSDHYNFAKKGVPIIFYTDGMMSDYHRPTDTPDKINYDLLKRRAQLVFYTAWVMANRDAMLPRDLPIPVNTR